MTDLPSPVRFLQEIIRIPSMPGEEAALAARVLEEMQAVGFDAFWTDAVGNAFGLCRGLEPGPAWLLLTHLDHVDVGDLSLWAHPPLEGVLEQGAEGAVVHGRGAVDIKGPLATHVYTVAALRAQGLRPRRDLVVAMCVKEETGGDGARFMVEQLPLVVPNGLGFDGLQLELGACIVAEPSSNRVMVGHRGVARATVCFHGRAHHASFARSSENPYFDLARFLLRLEQAQLPAMPLLGVSTIAPTLIAADTKSDNLTPNRVELMLNWRTTSETGADLRRILEGLCEGLNATFESYDDWQSGPSGTKQPGFYTQPEHPMVQSLQAALLAANPQAPEPAVWPFATDGRFTHKVGIPTVGFGPGNPQLAHTTEERIGVAELEFHIAVLSRFVLEHRP